MKPRSSSDPAALRRAAEARLKERAHSRPLQTEADARRLQHEVEVHQIELEMQNEELRTAQTSRATALERYTDYFDFAPVGYFNLTADGTITLVNLTGATMVGTERGRLVGRRFGLRVAGHDRRAFSDFLARVFATQDPQTYELALTAEDRRPLTVQLEATRSPDGQECRAVMIDITARKQTEALLACQTTVLEMIARGAATPETLTTLLRRMEEFAPGMRCSVLVLDEDGVHLRHGAAPGLPEAYTRAIDGVAIGPNVGSCGAAAFRREPVIVEDIATDPLWAEYRALALAHGLRACWSTPIFDEQRRVLGTFAIYYGQPGRPSAEHRRCIDLATHLAAIAIGKEQEAGALRRSEARFRRIMESDMMGMIFWNTAGDITEANDAFLHLVGYSRDDLANGQLQWRDMTPHEYRTLDENALAEVAATGVCTPFEKEYLRKDGSRVPVLIGGVTFPQQPGHGVAFVLDITVRKQTEALLRISDHALKSVSQGVLITGADQLITSANAAFTAITGYATPEILGRNCKFLQGPGTDPVTVAAIRAALGSPGEFAGEILNYRKDGTPFWNELTISPVSDETGRPTHFIGITRDITARKQAEALLRESEERFRATFEQAAVGTARLTPEGRWLEVNQRLCEIVGYTREELLTKTFQDITHPEDLETDLDFVRQMLAGEIQTYALEKRYWRKDGSLVWINLTVSLVREPAGAPHYFISVVEDIHARKQAEAALRQLNEELERRVTERTAELKEANQELDAFSHSVSHDLRAPLRAISGFGQFLGEQCASTLDERGRGLLRHMMEAAARMTTLIDDLLQFAHASRSELRRRSVDLSTLAQEVVRDFQQAAPERQVQFLCAPGLNVSGDARLLRVVLVNLLGNAWKYTGKAAEPRVEFGRLDGGAAGVFFIRDNGAGFDMKYLDRLFGAFQRLHSMAEFEGTGVGLATVQRIIHRHGGKIWAEAKVNEGATFYFTVPESSSSPAHGGNAG